MAQPTANGNGCVGSGNTCGILAAPYYSNGGGTNATPNANGAGDGTNGCLTGNTCGTCDTNYRANTETGKTLVSQCEIVCNPGQCLPTAGGTCVNATTSQWSEGGTVSYGDTMACGICPDGTKTSGGAGYGADEAADCGHILHIGQREVYLRSTRIPTATMPHSLNVKIGGTVFYGNMYEMTSGVTGHAKIQVGNTTYFICDQTGNSCTGIPLYY